MSTGKIQKYVNSVNGFPQPLYLDDIDEDIRRQREERKRQAGELVSVFFLRI
jgi:hypothetical protein